MGLEMVGICMSLEDAFQIKISDKDAGELDTVEKFYRYLIKSAWEAGHKMTPEEIWDKYINIVCNELGYEIHQIKREHHFYKDLGAG